MEVKLYFKPHSYNLAKKFMKKLKNCNFKFRDGADEDGLYIKIKYNDEFKIRNLAKKYDIEFY
jgi:hypothetical protein